MTESDYAPVPLAWIGPIRLSGEITDEVTAPLATYESPLWASVRRGARISMLCENGITATVLGEMMTRSILLVADGAATAHAAAQRIRHSYPRLRAVVAASSRFAELTGMTQQIAGNLLFLRFEFGTGDASGHNMTTLAAEHLTDYLLMAEPTLRYGSISGNYCTDKKATAVNAILGRGKNVVAEIRVPAAVVDERLHTSTERLVELNVRKNLIGTLLAGGIRSANAHYANMLLAFYVATGQDAANIVEGSQGITHLEDRAGDLYFSCTLPNIIVGTIGNGKHHEFVAENLARLGCREPRPVGANSRRLAVIAAAVVLCGELSLLAALTNNGELMRAHTRMERATSEIGA
ncbi:hydroxymethylglutaryl-CoA reductase [Nocardia colli]|uniref:Hydroxymethylglutaryl-CoA reductase n=1 Tax=Nocardia colli TaxID=2545717 RepID=A0A5N0EMF0_9NOCA|nr:hydroxymethylglutaryl-CoA reductase [Nocardia colli]KAA8889454.1 hydroxymethylglutaryl-CoA reductase [Nocardia colli]